MNSVPLSDSTPGPGTFLIVDGHAYAYRAFYAIRSLNSPTGRPTNAIFGFIKMLARMRVVLAPTHAAVVWDGGLAVERMEMLPDYKAQRPPMPDDLDTQIGDIREFLAAQRLVSLVRDGVEADDWIAALARQAESAGHNVVIASADKDFMQLVSARIGLLNPNDKTEAVWTAEQVRAKSGVAPGQIVDWLSLIGDSVDNIAGVPGVGTKTATDLLQRFGSVDQLYVRLGELKPGRLLENLQQSEAVVRRNQRLIRLREDQPAADGLAGFAIQSPDAGLLLDLYTRWGFRSLARELAPAPVQAELL